MAEVCVIDWQWTGWNIAHHDLIYFFSTSAADDCCADYAAMVRAYHEAFVASLPAALRGRPWPLAEAVRLFRLATLDYMRWAIAYRLVEETPAAMRARAEAVPVDVNQGEYRRSERRLSWLLQVPPPPRHRHRAGRHSLARIPISKSSAYDTILVNVDVMVLCA